MIDKVQQENLMKIVMEEVDIAISEENSPFAAILIDNQGNIIGKAHNTAKTQNNPILHAEINLITEVCRKLNTRDLSEYCLMSNAWSCSMCMSASIKAKIKNFIFGAPSEDNMNPNITVFDIKKKAKGDINITIGVLEKECKAQIEEARKMKMDNKNRQCVREKILVSACLLGVNCKYDGENNSSKEIDEFLKDYEVIPICPEIMGGLPTPRIAAERVDDMVLTKDGRDVTKEYIKGAKESLFLARKYNVKKALLKLRSPSCGYGKIYDGTFSHTITDGNGVTADLLKENGIEIITIK